MKICYKMHGVIYKFKNVPSRPSFGSSAGWEHPPVSAVRRAAVRPDYASVINALHDIALLFNIAMHIVSPYSAVTRRTLNYDCHGARADKHSSRLQR